MEAEGVLYETLGPLSSSATDQPPPPSSSSDDSEPYVVFRNQISLSSTQCRSPEAAAPDYFSLDTFADGEELRSTLISTPSPVATVVPVREPEWTLEGSWFRDNFRLKSPMLQLHKEILDFCDFLSPAPAEQESRIAAVERVFDVIKYIWPSCKPEVFGSFKTGLYLPSSDIDVVILDSHIKNPQIGLQALSRALSQKGIAKKIQVIGKARVPIIKFVEKKSGVSFDISFDAQNGPKAAEFIKDAVLKWPPIRPLCLILKVFLQQRELNEVYSGGIGSYALLTMLIAMLQFVCDSQACQEHNLGILLVNFFDMYGRKLNTSNVGVSCNGGGTFFLKSSRGFLNKERPSLISIEDPQAPENDIGKNSFNFFQVRSAFSMAFSALTNTKIILGLGPNRSILGAIIRPDEVLLERKGGSNGEMTFDKLLPGAAQPLQNQYGDQQEIYCNWQFNDYDEEPLPRGNIVAKDGSAESSRKKRKALKEKRVKELKENGDSEMGKPEEHGSSKKKQRWRHRRNDSNGRHHSSTGPPWSRTS